MSYDLMVFEAANAPRERKAFMSWYKTLAEWTEGHDYSDLSVSPPALRDWFMEMKMVFPPIRGEFAPSEEELDMDEELEQHTADYSIGATAVYVAFSWSVAEDAYLVARDLAARHGIGFFDVSGSKEVVFPDGSRMEIDEADERAAFLDQLYQWQEEDEYEEIAEKLKALPAKKLDYELAGILSRALNNMSEYEEAVRLLLEWEQEGKDDPLWYCRLGYAYYYLNRPAEAKVIFEKALKLEPEDEEVREFIGLCEEDLRAEELHPESAALYEEEELDALEACIAGHFGEFEQVFHEVLSPDIHVDIALITPVPERNFYTLVTMGMGAYQMEVPEELRGSGLERAELAVCLPPEWDVQNEEERWYWPIRWLKIMARLPGEENTWLGWGHTVSCGEPFAEDTRLSEMLLLSPFMFFDANEDCACIMPDGKKVNFYQMVPLYEEERLFKAEHGAEPLLDLFQSEEELINQAVIVNKNRRNVCF